MSSVSSLDIQPQRWEWWEDPEYALPAASPVMEPDDGRPSMIPFLAIAAATALAVMQ